MTARLQPCMGGFCARREACKHYHAPTYVGDDLAPAERLCGPVDGTLKQAPQEHSEPGDEEWSIVV